MTAPLPTAPTAHPPCAWHDYFDSWLAPPPLLDKLLAALPASPPAVVVLSPLRGHVALSLAARLPPRAALTVIEPSPTLSPTARHVLSRRARVLAAPLHALPLPDASQDLAWLHHLSLRDPADAPRALAEARRVLRPGGRLCVLTPDHIYLGHLPRARLLDLSTPWARLLPHPAEADRAEATLRAALPTWRDVLGAGFTRPHLIPMSAARPGPFSPADARTLRAALPPLGLEDPDEDPSVSAFHPASPFYLLDQHDALLIHSDWLICALAPPAAIKPTACAPAAQSSN